MSVETIDLSTIAPIIAQLGFSAIFLYLLFQEKKDNKEEKKKKDEFIEKLVEKFTNIAEKGAAVQEKVESNLGNINDSLKGVSDNLSEQTKTIQTGINIQDKLVDRVDTFLRDR